MIFLLRIDAKAGRWPSSGSEKLENKEFHHFSDTGVQVKLSRRETYPVTFADSEAPYLRVGYRTPDGSEYFEVTIDTARLETTITRDEYCTWPLFVYADETSLVIASDLQDLLACLPKPEIDLKTLASLLINPCDTYDTLFAGVRLLKRNERAQWAPGKSLESITTAQLSNIQHSGTSNPKEFPGRLEAVLDNYRRKVVDLPHAYEVSGGIDSATMPLHVYSSPYTLPRAWFASMRFPGEFSSTQAEKINDLQASCGLTPISIDISEETYPLSRFFDGGLAAEAFYQYQEIYTEPLLKLAHNLQNEGVHVVFTGIGGDELFEAVDSSDISESQPQIPAFYTSKLAEFFTQNQTASLDKSITDSAFFSLQSRNKIYIDQDIWPLSPLTNSKLSEYTVNLPTIYKANKNILRAYFEANNFPESIYKPVQNEHFGYYFETSIKRHYEDVIKEISKMSVLSRLGWVDWDEVMASLMKARATESDVNQELFAIYRLVSAEIILRAAA